MLALHSRAMRLRFDKVSECMENECRRSEEHTSELQSPYDLVCRLLLEKNNQPVLRLVDDDHCLYQDSSLAHAFIARRLVAERLGLLFSTRDVGSYLARLPALHLAHLDH